MVFGTELGSLPWKEFCELPIFNQERQIKSSEEGAGCCFVTQIVGAQGREAGFILFLVESSEQRIHPQLFPDRSKHRDFLTVHGTRWLMYYQSFGAAQHNANSPSSSAHDLKMFIKEWAFLRQFRYCCKGQPAAFLGQPSCTGWDWFLQTVLFCEAVRLCALDFKVAVAFVSAFLLPTHDCSLVSDAMPRIELIITT